MWVLVKGWHDSGTIDAVYGPVVKEVAIRLLEMVDGSVNNWTLIELQELHMTAREVED